MTAHNALSCEGASETDPNPPDPKLQLQERPQIAHPQKILEKLKTILKIYFGGSFCIFWGSAKGVNIEGGRVAKPS